MSICTYFEKRDFDIEGTNLLQAFINVAPFLNELIQDDIGVLVGDTEKIIVKVEAKTMTLPSKAGDLLVEGNVLTKAIRQNKALTEIVPKEIFGFPIAVRAIPIHNEHGKVIGGIGIGTSLHNSQKLSDMAESFLKIAQKNAASVGFIHETVQTLATRMEQMTASMQDVSVSAGDIGQISAVVKGISDQSNLLGLNATIEAARAGENGKGFAVVAEEVRKLATNSKENADQINNITQNIQQLLTSLNTSFAELTALTSTQEASIGEFSETIQEIHRQAEQLSSFAHKTVSQ